MYDHVGTFMYYSYLIEGKTNFGHFSTPLKPGPGGLDPSPIYHWKAHKLLYVPNISDLPDGQLTCLPFVTYLSLIAELFCSYWSSRVTQNLQRKSGLRLRSFIIMHHNQGS